MINVYAVLPYATDCDGEILGKCDKSTLTEQCLMELLVDKLVKNISFREYFYDVEGAYRDIYEWEKVRFNNHGCVSTINWYNLLSAYFSAGGYMDLQWIPPNVERFWIFGNGLKGSINTDYLPCGLKSLNIMKNKYEGRFELSHLPRTIINLGISRNSLSGTLIFSSLPPEIQVLRASHNLFSGIISLADIPKSLVDVDLSSNSFHGNVKFKEVTKSVEIIDLRKNKIDGLVDCEGNAVLSIPSCIKV